jgi:hypothetical protein
VSKLTKSVLKGIVKECLVEILAEGLQTSNGNRPDLKDKPVVSSQKKKLSKKQETVNLREFDKKVDSTVNALTDDPIMKEIFADTAKSTLQEQLQHDSRPGQGTPSKSADKGIDLDNIFQGVSTNWSKLAFSKSDDDNLT